MRSGISPALAIVFRAIHAQAMQNLRHQTARVVPSLTVAQRFVAAEIIAHPNQPVVVMMIPNGNLGGQGQPPNRRLIFCLALEQVVTKSGGVGNAEPQIIQRIPIGGNAANEARRVCVNERCGIVVADGTDASEETEGEAVQIILAFRARLKRIHAGARQIAAGDTDEAEVGIAPEQMSRAAVKILTANVTVKCIGLEAELTRNGERDAAVEIVAFGGVHAAARVTDFAVHFFHSGRAQGDVRFERIGFVINLRSRVAGLGVNRCRR